MLYSIHLLDTFIDRQLLSSSILRVCQLMLPCKHYPNFTIQHLKCVWVFMCPTACADGPNTCTLSEILFESQWVWSSV